MGPGENGDELEQRNTRALSVVVVVGAKGDKRKITKR